MNLLFNISYDGSHYHGYQVQANGKTICGVFQDSLSSLLGARFEIKGCSRTDAGVHARVYYLSVVIDRNIKIENLKRAMNSALPSDIVVNELTLVPDEFHARYNSVGKQYTYVINNGETRNPFMMGRELFYPVNTAKIDAGLLRESAQVLVGTHDFRSFNADKNREDTVRTLTKIEVYREGDMVYFIIEGSSFLKYMIRIIVGTLLDLTEGKLKLQTLEDVLMSKNRIMAGKTAPPDGLYLTDVFYNQK